MLARGWAFGVWALVAAAALYWGLKLFVKAPPAPPQAVLATSASGARGDLTRLFGADAAPPAAEPQPAADARFQLLGVLSPRSAAAAQEGLALIAVDGKPAKAFRVGAQVEGDTVLQAVRARGATLGPRGGPAGVALEIAPPAPAATGTLPDAAGRAAAAGTAPPASPAPGGPLRPISVQPARGSPGPAPGPPPGFEDAPVK